MLALATLSACNTEIEDYDVTLDWVSLCSVDLALQTLTGRSWCSEFPCLEVRPTRIQWQGGS